jgi:hypothetical protein
LTAIDRDSIRAFVDRDWVGSERRERHHWSQHLRRRGPGANVAASQALFLHMRGLRPDWPSERERAQDLSHHIELARALARAARAFAAG